jgi:predicted ATP-grasp superfamily ATP-dependent carboligase/phosphoglycolate phosphatase-like HAD superfamily hydrolase
MKKLSNEPIALVVGLCSHGLAMTRALHMSGVEVHAFEANPNLPGVKTNSAKIHLIANIKTVSLIDDLLSFRQRIPNNRQIVLFPTNDNNVKVIGQHIETLTPHFVLSWQTCAKEVLELLLKNNIEKRCNEQGLLYPKSLVLNELEDVAIARNEFEFPIIAKPVNPQSGFKALRCDTAEELHKLVVKYQDDLPILVQHWISGTDKDLFFGALYLDNGSVVSRFTGNKLESYPPAMGQTTVAVTSENKEIIPLTEKFFDGLSMSGPVSLEVKRDEQGRYWVIEPTVGRTDFWVGLCVAANCNLLYTEFLHCIKRPIPKPLNIKPTIWFDSEKDITAFARHLKLVKPWGNKQYKATFSYLTYNDLQPAYEAFKRTAVKLFSTMFGRSERKSKSAQQSPMDGYRIDVYPSLDAMPSQFKTLMLENDEFNIFSSYSWFQNFHQQVANKSGETKIFCLTDKNSNAAAILPMWSQRKKHFGVSFCYLESLTNYYSPIFDLTLSKPHISKDEAYDAFIAHFEKTSSEWEILNIFPIDEYAKQDILSSTAKYKLNSDSYVTTKNWYEKIEGDYQSYMTRIPSKTKNTIKRKISKLNKSAKWSVRVYESRKDVDEALLQYHDVYNNSWKQKEPFPNFINGLAQCAAEKGWLRLGILTIDETPVAAQFWLVANKTAYIYKLAYKEKYRGYSPGTILTHHMMQKTIEDDHVEMIDFLTGKDDFKKDWMHSSRDLFGIQITNKNNVKSVIFGLKNTISKFRARLLNDNS